MGRLGPVIRFAIVTLCIALTGAPAALGREAIEPGGSRACWTVRGLFGAVETDNRLFRDLSVPGGQQERRAFHLTSGTTLGASIERAFACKFGLEGGVLVSDLSGLFVFDSGPDPAFWGKGGEDVGFRIYTVGFNYHLTPGRRADFHIGPFVGLPDFDDAEFELMTMLPEFPGDARTFVQNLDGDLAWGIQLGLDLGFGVGSPWALNVTARAMDLSADAGHGLPAKIDLDPKIFSVGLSYSPTVSAATPGDGSVRGRRFGNRSCGNGRLEAKRGEQCDDGNRTDGDGCSAVCTVEASCGDGTLDPDEACDDGNQSDGDGCSAGCTVESYCGDGTRDSGEACDDGNETDGDGCSAGCTVESYCGDGTRDSGEECDDGNRTDGDGCSAGCALEASCGDGLLQAGEACDDGNETEGDGCSAVCTVESYCGDGTRDSNEECDDGNAAAGDGCSAKCAVEECGNGRIDSGEACDDGNRRSFDGCRRDCRIEFCGNGRVDLDRGEECDDGNRRSGDGCSGSCQGEAPGNGRIDPGEECDDGNLENGDGCSEDGKIEVCGNGRIEGLEACDDGNRAPGDGCGADCRETPFGCGNGVLEPNLGEECDDGDNQPGDGCGRSCQETPLGCGDGTLEPGLGEACDDGDNRNGDGCSYDCASERPDGSYCGDGRSDATHGEECDDKNRVAGDGCSADCLNESPPPRGCAPWLWLSILVPLVLLALWWWLRRKGLLGKYSWVLLVPLMAWIGGLLWLYCRYLPLWLCWLLLLLLLILLFWLLWRLWRWFVVPVASLEICCAAGIPALNRYRKTLEPIDQADPEEVCELFLAYRDSRGWQEMFSLFEEMSAEVQARPLVRQQLGFALNRDGQDGRAEEVLQALIAEHGASTESCGILGRVYKDRWEKAWRSGRAGSDGDGGAGNWLELAITTYLEGHEADPSDPYPGINVLTLCEFSSTQREQVRTRMVEEVTTACRARAASTDYWDVATRLELACHTGDEAEARATQPQVLEAKRPRKIGCPRIWKIETTRRNLRLLVEGRKLREAETPGWVAEIVSELGSGK